MTVIIDDHVLLACLSGNEPAVVRVMRGRSRLFTSGLWYHRLCRALVRPTAAGVLSSKLPDLPEETAARLLSSCKFLPDRVRVVSLRELAWPMAELMRDHRLNLMQLEALASARELGATICCGERNQSPPLFAAAETLGVDVVSVPL